MWAEQTVSAALAARAALQTARADLVALEASTGLGPTRVAEHVAADEVLAQRALHRLAATAPSWAARVPLLGRSIVAERTVATASLAVLAAIHPVVVDSEDLGRAGHVDVTKLRSAARALASGASRVRGPLAALARLDTGLTPPQVRAAVAEADRKLLGVGTTLSRAASFANALVDLLGGNGPRTLLFALENNAELRGSGGLVSSFAVGTSLDGRLHLGPFTDVDAVSRAPSGAVPVPAAPDYLAAYAPFLANTTLWKNATFSPDIPESAQVLAELAKVSVAVKPNFVVLIDVPAMAAILHASGLPVRLPDGTVATYATLVHDLLVQSYGAAPASPAGQRARRLALERVAGNVFRKIAARPPTLSLLRTLAEQAAGRHVAVYSTDPATQAELVAAGASGALRPGSGDIVLVSANNLGDSPGNGNKLDFYARRTVTVNVALSRTSARVVETVRLTNGAPPGLPAYVAGPRHPGRLSELIGFAMAARARITGFSVDGRPGAGEVKPLATAQQLLTEIVLQPGQTATFVLDYTVALTDGRYALELVPQPLVTPATLRLRVGTLDGARLSGQPPDFAGAWTAVRRVQLRVS